MNWVSTFLSGTWNLVAEMAPYLWLGFAIAALLHAVVKQSWVKEHLGKRGLWQTVKATLIGVPLPLCSCGVIPVAAGIRRQGGSAGATAAFTSSTPQTGVDSILATAGMISWPFAGVRVLVASVSGLVTGMLVDTFGDPKPVEEADQDEPEGCCSHEKAAETHACCGGHEAKEEAHSCCCSHAEAEAPEHDCCHEQEATQGCGCSGEAEAKEAHACCSHTAEEQPHGCCSHEEPAAASSCCCSHEDSHEGEGPRFAWAEGFRFGFLTLPRDLSTSLLVGFVLAGVLTVLLPSGALEQYIGSGWMEYVAATVVGLPLYVCATGSIPLAVALLAAGLSPGAVLIFLIVGPATNIATVIALRHLIGTRSTVLYIGALTVIAWISALIVDMGHWNVIGHVHDLNLQPAWWQHVLGVGLIALLAWPLVQRFRPSKTAATGDSCCAH